jgi:hypothetical protein
MTFKPSFSSTLPKESFSERAAKEPFLSFTDPSIKKEPLFLPNALRPQGLYIAGNPGSGKSSLLQHMVLSDIHAGRGVSVIDPTADLINVILDWIPESRVKDTIYFDTSDPIPIDFFSYHNADERQGLTDQLLNIFKLDNAPVARPRLQRIIGTLFDANEEMDRRLAKGENVPDEHRCTFLDIQTFIENPKRQKEILGYCSEQRQQLWRDTTIKLPDYVSITERMTPFTETPALKAMLECKRPPIKISEVMRDNKILLINLKDTDTDAFIGSLIASKFQQATFGRRELHTEEERTPYYLYVDECNTILEYAANDFEKMLLRARKYKLCLTLANQFPVDLPPKIQNKLGSFGSFLILNLRTPQAMPFKDFVGKEVFELFPQLPKFSAIHFTSSADPCLVETPRFLPDYRTIPGHVSYAQIIKKRTVDKQAGNDTEPVVELKQDVPTSDGNAKDPNFLRKHPQEEDS